jgi:cell wall-associated NlpC family hydrolase
MGYPMMRVADDQARDNRYLFVSREALQPGDAIFFYESAGDNPDGYIGHAGMYVGNGIFIHSTGSNGGVSFDCLDNNDYGVPISHGEGGWWEARTTTASIPGCSSTIPERAPSR